MLSANGKSTKTAVIWLLAAFLIVAFAVSLTIGRLNVPIAEAVKILLSRIGLYSSAAQRTWSDQMEKAVINIRLPRITLACMIGCCLSAAGAAYQGVFRNPMASPDILGASSGAAFGAALAILMGASSGMITLSAFIFSMLTVLLAMLIAKRAGGDGVANLILAGIMLSSLFSAGTSYIKLAADPSNQLPAITYWLMGSLSGTRHNTVYMAAIPMLAGCVTLILSRWRLNLLTLGDDEARSMGVNAALLRAVVIAASTLITAASIASAGMIGWVGLVVPHMARKLVGSDYRRLMGASMLLGASFLLIVDDVSRNLTAAEIPIGILTAFVGAPFFIYLLCSRRKPV